MRVSWSSMPRRAVRSAVWSGPGSGASLVARQSAWTTPAHPWHSEASVRRPVTCEGALGDAHPLLVAECEASELLCPRVASLGYFQLSIHVLSVGNL